MCLQDKAHVLASSSEHSFPLLYKKIVIFVGAFLSLILAFLFSLLVMLQQSTFLTNGVLIQNPNELMFLPCMNTYFVCSINCLK